MTAEAARLHVDLSSASDRETKLGHNWFKNIFKSSDNKPAAASTTAVSAPVSSTHMDTLPEKDHKLNIDDFELLQVRERKGN